MDVIRKFTRSQPTYEKIGFAIFDRFNREIGASLERSTIVVSAEIEERPYHGGTQKEPGTYYSFRPHATRNARNYGASQRSDWFNTEEEREAAIQKYLAGARKRATRGGAK